MSTRYQYENLLREPVEYWSAAMYGMSAISLVILPEVFLMPQPIAWAGASLMALRGLSRFRFARRLSVFQSQLTSLASFTKSSSEIGYSDRDLWIGKGFAWDASHTQRLFDLEKSENKKFKELPKLYQLARAAERRFEYNSFFRPFTNFTRSQNKWNFVKPLPDVGGKPELHSVGMWEGEQDIYLPLEHRNGHTLVLGTTRVGKTRLLEVVVAQDIRRGDVVFVFDPKGDADLLLRMYAECLACGRIDDFHIFHLGHPEISDAYNPIGSFMRLTEVASRVAGQMPGDGVGGAFREFVWGYVNTIASVLVTMGKRPSYEILKQHTETIEPLFIEYMEWHFSRCADKNWHKEVAQDEIELGKDPKKDRHPDFKFKVAREMYTRGHRTVALYKYYKEHPDINNIVGNQLINKINYDSGHMGKLIASLQPFLDKMTTGKVADLLIPNGDRPIFDWNDIIQKGGVVYIGLDALSDPEVASAVGNSMFADLTSIAGRIYKTGSDYGLPIIGKPMTGKKANNRPKKRKIQLHADEFNELIGAEFIPMLNKAGGAGIQVMAYTQTLPDIAARLGNADKAEQVIGNFNTLIMLRVLDVKTAKLMVDRQKPVMIKTVDIISGSSDNSDVTSDAMFSSSTTQRQTSQKMDLLTANDLLRLPKGQAFALINGNTLYKIRMPLPDPSDLANIPQNILDISKSMRQSYQSVPCEQFRFNEYLSPQALANIDLPQDNFANIEMYTPNISDISDITDINTDSNLAHDHEYNHENAREDYYG
ncbi:conjugative coupling factor TraD, PFGI-1 class [Gammaproteobacteria bacterium]|nr:conjugative coupling factor TraD, PFGI-1 class [Gammaproteobacteria bacterium]